MAGFKAFSGIHTTGCVFHFFSFISPQSGRRFRWNISRRRQCDLRCQVLIRRDDGAEEVWEWAEAGRPYNPPCLYFNSTVDKEMCLYTITNCHYMEIGNTIHLNYIFCKNSGQKQPAPQYATVRLNGKQADACDIWTIVQPDSVRRAQEHVWLASWQIKSVAKKKIQIRGNLNATETKKCANDKETC